METIRTTDIANASREEIATELRHVIGGADIKAWYLGRTSLDGGHVMQRQSDMRKLDWIALHREKIGGDKVRIDLEPIRQADHGDQSDQSDDEGQSDQPEAKPAAPVPAPADLERVLDGLGLVLSDKALSPLRNGIAAIAAERDKARADAEQARNAAKQAEAMARAVPAYDPAPVPAGDGSKHQTRPVRRENIADLFPRASQRVRDRNIVVEVCDNPDAPRLDPNYLWPKETPDIIAALSSGFNVYISGDRGTGKSSLVRNIAALLKRPLFQIGFHSETASSELFGFFGVNSEGMEWVPGDLLKAMQTPFAVIDLSEISAARPELTMQLTSVLETSDRSVFVGGKRYGVHPTVWFVATSNDDGSGEKSGRFHGTRAVNPAIISRFAFRPELNLPDAARLSRIIQKQTGLVKPAADMLADMEKKIEAGGVRTGDCEATPGLRALVGFAGMVRSGMPAREAFVSTILNGSGTDDAAFWQQWAAANFDFGQFENMVSGKAPEAVSDEDGDDEIETRTRAGFPEIN